jgi:TolB protein
LTVWWLLPILFFTVTCSGKRMPATAEPTSGILFVSERDGNWEIYLIQPDGSGLTRLTEESKVDADPAWSPDGRQIAFRSRRDGSSDIFVMGADGSNLRNLIRDRSDSMDDEFSPVWNPDGETLALFTDRFQPPIGGCWGSLGVHHLALMPVTGGQENIRHFDALPGGQESFTWSPDGRNLILSSACSSNTHHLYRWDRETDQVEGLTDGPSNDLFPAWSHDGRQLAFSATLEGRTDIFLLELATGTLTNLTAHPAKDKYPTWSPDDSQIAFTTDRDGNEEIYVMDADGSNPRNLTQNPARDFRPAWSPVP